MHDIPREESKKVVRLVFCLLSSILKVHFERVNEEIKPPFLFEMRLVSG